jgi:hypothetical protein
MKQDEKDSIKIENWNDPVAVSDDQKQWWFKNRGFEWEVNPQRRKEQESVFRWTQQRSKWQFVGSKKFLD